MDAETESDKKSWIGWCQPKKALSAKIGAMPLAVYVIAADAKSAVRLIEARLTIEYSDKHLFNAQRFYLMHPLQRHLTAWT